MLLESICNKHIYLKLPNTHSVVTVSCVSLKNNDTHRTVFVLFLSLQALAMCCLNLGENYFSSSLNGFVG